MQSRESGGSKACATEVRSDGFGEESVLAGMCIVRRLLRGGPNPCPLPAPACRLENRASKKQQQIEKAEINFKVRLADGRHM